ncbi:MAG: YbhB/YbcL family Raf kinase inhibitor-like protein [Thermoflexales bacterium]|nr:YbhB/YbcL family Raf kinase inhibitor-like protein [Thermoflexales bacterium]
MRGLIMGLVLLAVLGAACQPAPAIDLGGDVPTFKFGSPAFAEGATIPVDFTCGGQDKPPELRWSEAPANTRSFALIMDDPDAPGGTFTHWVLFNIPATVSGLTEGDTTTGLSGANGFGKAGYGGPCPPPGNAHRYFFKLYALDVEAVNLTAGAARTAVEAALKSHIIGQAQLMGRYGR